MNKKPFKKEFYNSTNLPQGDLQLNGSTYVRMYVIFICSLYFYLHKVLIKTDLRLLNVETASVYLKENVRNFQKKM